jgi:hypothetical protein
MRTDAAIQKGHERRPVRFDEFRQRRLVAGSKPGDHLRIMGSIGGRHGYNSP